MVKPPAGPRVLAWRAVVHVGQNGADAVQTAWHLAECAAPGDPHAHCPEGQRMLELSGEPDGHCLVHDRCPRCA